MWGGGFFGGVLTFLGYISTEDLKGGTLQGIEFIKEAFINPQCMHVKGFGIWFVCVKSLHTAKSI